MDFRFGGGANQTVIGFSLDGSTIPPSNGLLVNVSFTEAGDELCLLNPYLSDINANPFDVDLGDCFNGFGCTDISACNYDDNAVEDDGSCEYVLDCLGECGGIAIVDECGVCDGGNLDQDCAGECFGSALEDCAGVCNGDSIIDMCGVCDSDTSNDCIQDCLGTWGGTAVVDDCGVCDGGNLDQDCAGECFGSALEDCAGTCNGCR